MSWTQFRELIEDRDANVTHWMHAIESNPNTPEAALKVAILQTTIDPQDMAQLENLCAVMVQLAQAGDRCLGEKIKIKDLRTPDDIETIECLDCGAKAAGHELTQDDVDLLKKIDGCLMCSADSDQLVIMAVS